MLISFCGTKDFLIELENILCDHCNINRTKITDRGNIFVFNKGGRLQVEKILQYIYKDATIYLQRKYQKYQLIHNYNLNKGLDDKRNK